MLTERGVQLRKVGGGGGGQVAPSVGPRAHLRVGVEVVYQETCPAVGGCAIPIYIFARTSGTIARSEQNFPLISSFVVELLLAKLIQETILWTRCRRITARRARERV